MDESDEVTIAEVAQMVADAFELEHGIVLDETKSDGQMKKTASNQKLRKYLPDYKFTPLKSALKTTVDWFIQNYETARKWSGFFLCWIQSIIQLLTLVDGLSSLSYPISIYPNLSELRFNQALVKK